jgi:glycosyltransferase involved in cell wall biosynthesis
MYAICDVMVNSSYIEGLPMTILEAMASRLPVIATKVGAVEDVIQNKKNGILLEAGDADALAEALEELITDKEKRQEYAEKSYQDVCKRFSDTHMAQRYQQIYTEVN